MFGPLIPLEHMAAFDARAPLSGPSAIGQLLPKCRPSQMRQGLPFRVGWRLLESGHCLGEEVRYKASGIAFINAMIF